MQLDHLAQLPPALAEISLSEIKKVFANPTLVSIPGERPEPVFVSTLLHGNETTSFHVLQHLQRAYAASPPPRSLLVFVGNVEAAAKGLRVIEEQEDFNRIWAHGGTAFHALAQEVLAIAQQSNLFASIDVHNNTGANPLYGCVNALRPADLQMAQLFAPVGVFYRNPPTTQSIAFSQLCPSVTVECGKSGDAAGIAAAIQLVEDVLRLEAFDTNPPEAGTLEVYETLGRVVVDPSVSFAFGEANADLALRSDLEQRNFRGMRAGQVFGTSSRELCPLRVRDEHGGDITREFFKLEQGAITLTCDVTPAMITKDLAIIRQDCLCYLMRPI